MVTAILLVPLGGFGVAQDPDPQEDTIREELLRIIRELEVRVGELEERLAALSGSTADEAEIRELRRQIELLTRELEKQKLGEVAQPVATESRYGLGPAASKVYGVEQGPTFGGYGEALLESFDSERDDGSGSGKTDQFDFLRAVFYFGYKFNDRLLFNSEIEYEHASTGEEGEVSVEFAYLDFQARPEFGVRGGLLLAPIGFINELHEPPVFLGARRPNVDRVILPTTWRENGAGVYGDIGAFTYRAYVMNSIDATGFTASSGIRGGRQDGSKALAEDFALTGRLDWNVGRGFLAGGSLWTGDTGQGQIPADANTTLWDLHAEWKTRGWWLRAVYAEVNIDDTPVINVATGEVIGEKLIGWYGEIGYDVLSSAKTEQGLIPYLRYEEYNTQKEVAFGFSADPANDIELLTVGIAWQPILQIMLKADYQDFENAAGTGNDQVNFAITYLF
jgi:hypothetical protein